MNGVLKKLLDCGGNSGKYNTKRTRVVYVGQSADRSCVVRIICSILISTRYFSSTPSPVGIYMRKFRIYINLISRAQNRSKIFFEGTRFGRSFSFFLCHKIYTGKIV